MKLISDPDHTFRSYLDAETGKMMTIDLEFVLDQIDRTLCQLEFHEKGAIQCNKLIPILIKGYKESVKLCTNKIDRDAKKIVFKQIMEAHNVK